MHGPSVVNEQVETVDILCEWIAKKELTAVDAAKMFREQYGCGLDYLIRTGIWARLLTAQEKR
jgi:hypothetical protein